MAFRLLLTPSARHLLPLKNEMTIVTKLPAGFVNSCSRMLSTVSLNKNITLISHEGFTDSKPFKTFKDQSKPTVILMTWLLARKKHVMKYCDLYLKNGFNVMTCAITPWQFFWPLTGSQVVAEQLLNVLESQDRSQQRLIVHGFSVGAYLWGEALVRMNSDLARYQPLMSNIVGQIWDSAADVTETSKGLPFAMFPKNAFLRSTMEKYVNYHLKTFYEAATQHYLRASQLFHTTPVHATTVIFVSKNDLIGSFVANEKCKEYWESVGMKVYWQAWEKSRHVSHLMLHRETYLKIFYTFLNDVLNDQQKQAMQMRG